MRSHLLPMNHPALPRASYPFHATSTEAADSEGARPENVLPSGDTGCVGEVLHAPDNRLVGRDGELRRLLALRDAAAAGEPAAALVSGDAGVGKPRLTAELACRAAERGFTVLSGRCAELGDSIPYLPLADALREATSGPGTD